MAYIIEIFITKPKKSNIHLEISITLGCKRSVRSRFFRFVKYKLKKCFSLTYLDIKSKVLEKCRIFSGACVYAIVGLEPDVVIVGAACTITTAMHPLFFFLSFSVATFHCQCHCCSHITYECASTHI